MVGIISLSKAANSIHIPQHADKEGQQMGFGTWLELDLRLPTDSAAWTRGHGWYTTQHIGGCWKKPNRFVNSLLYKHYVEPILIKILSYFMKHILALKA